MLYEKQGNSAAAAKERKLASDWRMSHYKSGGHKRRSLEKGKEDGPMTNMCLQAKAVSLQNHGNASGAAGVRAKINQAQLKKESQVADSTAVKNHQKEGWKGTTKKAHH
jgi:hypothetical protein